MFWLLIDTGQTNLIAWYPPMKRSASLIRQLENITDPRRGESLYPLVNILFMTICAVIAGADDFVSIAKFANTKKQWSPSF